MPKEDLNENGSMSKRKLDTHKINAPGMVDYSKLQETLKNQRPLDGTQSIWGFINEQNSRKTSSLKKKAQANTGGIAGNAPQPVQPMQAVQQPSLRALPQVQRALGNLDGPTANTLKQEILSINALPPGTLEKTYLQGLKALFNNVQ